jgi:hypothetical protein
MQSLADEIRALPCDRRLQTEHRQVNMEQAAQLAAKREAEHAAELSRLRSVVRELREQALEDETEPLFEWEREQYEAETNRLCGE